MRKVSRKNKKCLTKAKRYGKQQFVDANFSYKNKARLTYKIVISDENGCNSAADGAISTVHPASIFEEERYKLLFKVINKLDE